MPSPLSDGLRKRSRSGPIAVLVVVAALVLYPLSIGPAVWLDQKGWLPEDAALVYVPLEWLYERTPASAAKPVEWYVELWMDEDKLYADPDGSKSP